jgi:uncharacterized membrane protein YhhN
MNRVFIVVWAVLLGSSFVPELSGVRYGDVAAPTGLRVLSSLVLVASAWTHWSARRAARGVPWIAIGMTFGCLGDALALPPAAALPAPRLLLAMGLFGVGHVAYIRGFLGAIRGASGATVRAAWLSAAAWLVVVLVAWQVTVNAAEPPSPLRWPALGYALLLGGTAAAGPVLARERPRMVPVAVGAALFLLSDFLLAYQAFRGGFPFDTALCWATYGPGQMLIVTGWRAAEPAGPAERP